MFFYILVIVVLPHVVLGSTPLIAKPGCSDKCGNLSIPYPFGIGEKCYHNRWFAVECVVDSNKIILLALNVSLDAEGIGHPLGRQIDVRERTLTIGFQCQGYCFDSEENITESLFAADLRGSPFRYSSDRNTFLVVGCGGDVVLMDSHNNPLAGCAQVCRNGSEKFKSKHCYGVGCCQTTLPFPLDYFWLEFFVNPSESCSIPTTAILVDKDWISNQVIDPKLSLVDCPVPAILEWTVKDLPVNSPSYSNSTCIYKKSNNGGEAEGYVCQCKGDYKGNPYLPYGCQGCLSLGNDTSRCRKDINPEFEGNTPKESIWLILVLGIGVSIGLQLLLLCAYWIYKVMKRRRETRLKARYLKRNGGMVLAQLLSSEESKTDKARIFSSSEMANATDKYNNNRILGHGGEATVFKGMLSDGRLVAIKKFKSMDARQLNNFINEVSLLSEINHRNIIKLVGCCLETEIPMLVYEYVPNGTLSEQISSPNEDFPCTWDMRLQIAIDITNGLAYLHSSSIRPIFHRDVKATNILLDSKYRAKLSDFGISRSVDIDQTHVTTRVIGTFGYLDPEYFQSHKFSDKSDVYSFGVVLIELLTGELAGHSTKDERGLVPWFRTHVQSNSLSNILDARVARSDGGNEKAKSIAELATRCLLLDGTNRPSMKEIEATLQAIKSSQEGWQNNLSAVTSMVDDAGISMTGDTTFRRFNRFGTY
ncbi:wall-associated receptor kinase-like 8 [Silene latifolia]|uniref:wall-associated receptor kinase-like 8 n=1 Tax=Silene latifolia TaxID=37657 RepID=UPI003D7835C2